MAPIVTDRIPEPDVPPPTSADIQKLNQARIAANEEEEENNFFGAVMYTVEHFEQSDSEDDIDGTDSRRDVCDRGEFQQRGNVTPSAQQQKYKHIAETLDEVAKEVMRSRGPRSYRMPTVRDFIGRADNYDSFATLVNEAFNTASNADQLAIFYGLSCEIFKFAATSEIGVRLADWVKAYFRRKMLPWIMENNGLEHCIQSTPSG